METISLVIAWLFIVLFGYLALRLISCVGRNLYEGLVLRRKLRKRLSNTRLEQALERSGSDPSLYLHDRQLCDIEQQMRNCERCTQTEVCDEALEENVPTERFRFCPDYTDLFKPGKTHQNKDESASQ